MALNTFKCNYLTPLHLKGLMSYCQMILRPLANHTASPVDTMYQIGKHKALYRKVNHILRCNQSSWSMWLQQNRVREAVATFGEL